MKNRNPLFLLILTAMLASTAHAQHTMNMNGSPMVTGDAKKETAEPAANMTEAEVRKIDLDNKKITLKHGEIKNLDMPPMSMVFSVKDPAMLESLKAGDKVKFTADKVNGAFTVLTIEKIK